MGKCKNATKRDTGAQKGTYLMPASHGGNAGYTGNTAQDLMEEVASLEEVLLQMGTSTKMPFRFTQSSRLPSKWSLPPECWWGHSITPEDQMCYYIHIRWLFRMGGVINPLSHAWSGLLIADILQEACPKDQITKALVLSPREAILFFGRSSCNERFLYWKAKVTELGLGGSFKWARKPAQIEVTINTMQGGCWAIADAVMEK